EFLPFAEKVLQLLSEGRRRVADLRELRLGAVTILCAPTIATYWLPQLICRFRALHPGVEIRIHERAGCVSEDLSETIADLGIVQLEPRAVPSRASGRALREDFLFVDEQVLVLPTQHRLARKLPPEELLSLAAVADEPFVLHHPPCGLSLVGARAFERAGIRPRVTLETSQIEAVCEMVAAGLGVALMPKMAMMRRRPNLAWRNLTEPKPTRTIGLALFPERSLSPPAAAFADLARDEGKRLAERIADWESRATGRPAHRLVAVSSARPHALNGGDRRHGPSRLAARKI
ncbi:MAG: LysR family transcriptional regulator substrate-binding protein, partial [Vicinamibacteria bacterium]